MRKKHETRKVPPGAPSRMHRGKHQALIQVDGRGVWCDLTATGRARVVRPEWYASLKLANGQTKTVKLCRDKTTAEMMLAKLRTREDQIRAGLVFPVSESGENFSDLLERFWKHRARSRCTAVYLKSAQVSLRKALGSLGVGSVLDIRGLSKAAWEKWADAPVGGMVKHHQRVQLKVFLKWLHHENLLASIPDVPKIKITYKELRRPARRHEVDQLQKVAPWPRGIFYALAFCTLARRNALIGLRPEDFNLGQSPFVMLRAHLSKTGIDQQIPLPPRLVPQLKKLVKECPPGAGVFDQINDANFHKLLDHDLELAGIPRVTTEGKLVIHSFRHGGATELLEKGVSVLLVQRMGGWKSLAMLSKHYAHLSPVRSRKEIDSAFE